MGGGDDEGYKLEGHGRRHDTVGVDTIHCEQTSYSVRTAYIYSLALHPPYRPGPSDATPDRHAVP